MVQFTDQALQGHSGSPWPIIPPGSGIGEECTVIGSSVEEGDVVMAAASTDPLLDTSLVSGPGSHMTVVELPVATSASLTGYGFFGVVTKGASVGGKCRVAWGPCTVKVKVYGEGGQTYVIGDALDVEFAVASGPGTSTSGGPGTVKARSNGQKVTAKIAQAAAIAASDTTELLWVHWDGIHGWGANS